MLALKRLLPLHCISLSVIANLNLEAGHKAIEMSDFTSAFNFFDHGISFLKKRHWEEHYELSLALFNGATQSSFAIGDLDSLQVRILWRST